jgi:antitoxin MazE
MAVRKVKTRIVRIGSSHGIRIPKPVLEQTGLRDEVELDVQDDRLVIRRARRPRQGWEQAFRRMHEQGEDVLLDPETPTRWDESEWEWH